MDCLYGTEKFCWLGFSNFANFSNLNTDYRAVENGYSRARKIVEARSRFFKKSLPTEFVSVPYNQLLKSYYSQAPDLHLHDREEILTNHYNEAIESVQHDKKSVFEFAS